MEDRTSYVAYRACDDVTAGNDGNRSSSGLNSNRAPPHHTKELRQQGGAERRRWHRAATTATRRWRCESIPKRRVYKTLKFSSSTADIC
eukprot:6186693-Pleurochrysis_carterae.AAC.2